MIETVTLTKTVFLKAPREVVWGYLTESEKLARWFHPAEADLAADQAYALLGKADSGEMVRQCWGKVVHWAPPGKLVYSFTVKPLNGLMTQATWTLEDVLGGTKLTLNHEGIPAGDVAALGLLAALDAGWDEHFVKLRRVARVG